ncbi:MAG TPA: DedA family protein [Chloroflexota bacterium]|nr:DedA family protein [Chloroflexota bacterium]
MAEAVATFIVTLIGNLGYPGIVLAMAIESALIPLPSEIIMPFSGYLVSTGRFDFTLVMISGALGNLLGSLVAYGIGYWGDAHIIRYAVRRYGKLVLITESELDDAEHLLQRFQDWVVVGGRLLPGIRTVISLPCGMSRVPLVRFSVLTFLGSAVWSAVLAWVGLTLGEHWNALEPLFRKTDAAIAVGLVMLAGLYVAHKLRRRAPA